MNQNWTDLNKDGRRLNRIIRQLETNQEWNRWRDETGLHWQIDQVHTWEITDCTNSTWV